MSAIDDIAAERDRQVKVEGFGAGRDDGFVHGQLARGAAAFAEFAGESDERRATAAGAPSIWPWWSLGHWKPKDRRADLVRAGALIVAEIERLDRAKGA
ncbi:hypothetical protein [Reyranella sp.]|uniref:hypothetical protein n=1 Tax=Reyranella sp. TaxID=1929291 RepID=UPI003BAA8E43